METSDINVELIDYMGDDTRVPFVARVSTKEYKQLVFDPVSLKLDFKQSGIVWQGERDEGLIDYMAENGHWSPFAHCMMSFRVTAPLFVARQLQKSTVGLAWNEISRRYVNTPPAFYIPEPRKKAEHVKQGSSEEVVKEVCFDDGDEPPEFFPTEMLFEAYYASSLHLYNSMIAGEVAPEVARAVLPQGMMTQWIWTGSLYAFARVCHLRLDSHAQKESGIVARKIYGYMQKIFPVSTKYLLKEIDNADEADS